MLKTIYALLDPRDGTTRYIGATQQTFARRRCMHIHSARSGARHPCAAWIRELLSAGLKPVMQAISSDMSDWQEAERAAIARARLEGHHLLNQTDGGLGMLGCVPEKPTRLKRSRTLKQRYAQDVLQMQQRQELARSAGRSEASRDASRSRMTKIWSDPVLAEKMREAMRGKQKRGRQC